MSWKILTKACQKGQTLACQLARRERTRVATRDLSDQQVILQIEIDHFVAFKFRLFRKVITPGQHQLSVEMFWFFAVTEQPLLVSEYGIKVLHLFVQGIFADMPVWKIIHQKVSYLIRDCVRKPCFFGNPGADMSQTEENWLSLRWFDSAC